MVRQTSFTYKLDSGQQAKLTRILRTGNYRPVSMPHTLIAARAEDCSIALFRSGKCLVQGKGAADFVTFTLEPSVLEAVSLGYEDVLNPEANQPHIGVDESGKGDFFGPLVTAGAYVDETLAPRLKELGVKDSKRISSDKRALALGRDLRKALRGRFSIVRIGPRAYNRLYMKMRNVNRMLSWAHARTIENLLETVPNCPRAISDQFGSKEQVQRALMKKGRKIELVQRHRAEDDLAVAAASILAREAFLRALKDFENEYGQSFPKGASASVQEAATELVKKLGPEILVDTAKCHFKTTDAVLEKSGSTREALGPEGKATSKATYRRGRQSPVNGQ